MKVYLIDDHQLFRDGMVALLESKNIKALCSSNYNDGLRDIKNQKLKIDAILLDLRMPDISGLSVLKIIKKQKIKIPVIILTTSSNEEDLYSCLQIGAQGYLLKDMNPDELVDALTNAVDGSIVVAKDLIPILQKNLTNKLIDKFIKPKDANGFVVIAKNLIPMLQQPIKDKSNEYLLIDKLTKREKEVACNLAEGYSNKIIARKLGITDGTIKLHVKSILKKLKLSSRVNIAIMLSGKNYCNKEKYG